MRRNASTVVILAGSAPGEVLAAVGRSMNVSRSPGPAGFEQEAVRAVTAWRAGLFELPDYYLVLAASPGSPGDQGPDFHLGPLRSARLRRVAFVAGAEPAAQAAGVLHALGSLRHGPWWPGLDELINTARRFYPDSLAEGNTALAAAPAASS